MFQVNVMDKNNFTEIVYEKINKVFADVFQENQVKRFGDDDVYIYIIDDSCNEVVAVKRLINNYQNHYQKLSEPKKISAHFLKNKNYYYVYAIAVLEKYRGKYLGGLLLNKTLEIVDDKDQIMGIVIKTNIMKPLYIKKGFIEKDIFARGSLYMKKEK